MLWTRARASRPRLQPSPDRRKLSRETNQLGVMAESLPFEDVELAERAIGEPILHVDVDGFEGPLDLLLELARRQKVDLHRISILALAEQYLVFIEEARRMRLPPAPPPPPPAGRPLHLPAGPPPPPGRLASPPSGRASCCPSCGRATSRARRILRPRSPSACAASRPSARP